LNSVLKHPIEEWSLSSRLYVPCRTEFVSRTWKSQIRLYRNTWAT